MSRFGGTAVALALAPCHAIIILTMATSVVATNDYTLVATAAVCPEEGRIALPCGYCGPNWGSLQDCEDTCNTFADCTHITYYDDMGCRVYNGCALAGGAADPGSLTSRPSTYESGDPRQVDVRTGTTVYERHNASVVTRPLGPCDIFDEAGTPCVAAHSVVRAMYTNYSGPLYRLVRASDFAGYDVGSDMSGFAKASDQDSFCSGTTCYILRIFDQSGRGNHLDTAPAGGACHHALKPVTADKHPLSVGGRSVYGAYFEGNMGYRNDVTDGVATGQMEQTMYMVTRGDHYNGGCCFDYGNAETDNNDDGKGTMEAIYFGSSRGWGHGQGDGPWIMADIENGLYAGDTRDAPEPSINHTFVTAFVKGKVGGFAIKGGDAQAGTLTTYHEGKRPAGYETMKLQGAIILGIGGDASCGATGTFYEGAMTASYSSDETDAAVQANIVAAGYGLAFGKAAKPSSARGPSPAVA